MNRSIQVVLVVSALVCPLQVWAQQGEIFADGFESGNTSAWSSTFPLGYTMFLTVNMINAGYDCHPSLDVNTGNQLCNAEATAFGLTGTFRAWLSDANDSPSSSFNWTHATIPYALPSGVVIANNWADLTDGTILAPINEIATGSLYSDIFYFTSEYLFWTGTMSDGTRGNDCDNWTTSTFPSGDLGSMSAVDSGWSASTTATCSCQINQTPRPILCVEQ